jgi:hypothetical protein
MQLAIIAPKSATTTETVSIKWIAKGGSSIVSADGRFSLRKNSKGAWRVFDNGNQWGGQLISKEDAKAVAQARQDAASADLTNLKESLANGAAHVYSVRGDGTMRRRHILTGQDLLTAKQIQDARELGKGMAFIAGEMHVSVSQVRRILIDLAITQELLEAEASELEALLVGATEAITE